MSRHLFGGLLIASLALALVGCASAATPIPSASPVATASPTLAPTASPAIAPTASPTVAPSVSPSDSPAAQVSIAPFTSVAADLVKAIPASYLDSCQPNPSGMTGTVISSEICQATGVQALTYWQFGSSADLQTSFAYAITQISLANDTSATSGKCGLENFAGTWDLAFIDGKKVNGPDFGLLCYLNASGNAFIDQADPTTNVLVAVEIRAVNGDSATARANLFTWWQNNLTTLVNESRTP